MPFKLKATIKHKTSIADECKSNDMFKKKLKKIIGLFAEELFIEIMKDADNAQSKERDNIYDTISVSVCLGDKSDIANSTYGCN